MINTSLKKYIFINLRLGVLQVLPHPVINPVPPGLPVSVDMVPGEMLSPLISLVAVTSEMSLGEKPGPLP